MPVRILSVCLALGVLTLLCPATATHAADITAPLTVQWIHSLGEEPTNTTTPAVRGERVYLTHRGVVHCLDARTGAEQWTFSVSPAAIVTSPVPWEDLIIVGGSDARLYGLDAATGDKVWELGCAGRIAPDPLIFNDLLILGAAEMVYAVAPRTGQATWICPLTSPAKVGPVSDGSMLYFLCADSSIQCVDGTAGRHRWRTGFSTGPRTFPPVIAGRRVVIATGRSLHGISRHSSLVWSQEMPAGIGGAPVLVDDVLYVPCVDGRIYTLYPRSGTLRREVTLKLDDAVTSRSLVTNTAVVAGTASGLLYLLDRDSGKLEWAYRCRTPEQHTDEAAEYGIYAPIVGSDGSVYCRTGSGDLYRFSAGAPDSAGPNFSAFQPEPGSALPAGRTLDVTFAVTDAGSGVDPSSLQVTLDGATVEVEFEPASGLATIHPSSLAEGPHIVTIVAKDYRGNVGTAEWSFLTDSSIGPAEGELGRRTTLAGRTTQQRRGR